MDDFSELKEVTDELVGLHAELAQVLQDERRTKAHAFVGCDPTASVQSRDRVASYEALEATCAKHELEGRIAGLKERQLLLTTLIEHAS